MSVQVVRDAMVPEPTMLGAGENAQEGGRCLAEDEPLALDPDQDPGSLVL